MKRSVLTSSLILLHSLSTLASSTTTPPLTLTPLSSSGGACLPNSTIATSILTLNQTSTSGYYELHHTIPVFTPWTEIYMPAHDQRRNCKMNFTASIAEGWKVRVNSEGSDVAGYLRLADNTSTASFWASWGFETDNSTASASNIEFVGPMMGRFDRHVEQYGKGRAVSGCSGKDVLQTQFWIRAFSGNQFPEGEVGVPPQPGDSEREWSVRTGVEVVRC